MPSFSIKIAQPALFEVPGFSTEQMRGFGVAIIDTMKERLATGVNVLDSPAKPLSKGYAKLKQRRGAAPIRNLRLSGRTIAAMSVLNASSNSVTVGFADAEAFKRALFSQDIDPMFGLSPKNVDTVTGKAFEALSQNARARFASNRVNAT
jgi:hypothetical protein